MRFSARIPRVVSSTVTAGPEASRPVLDGSDVTVPNRWKIPPHTVALVGRPAVWTSLDVTLPAIPLGVARIPSKRVRFEQDFGGHLFLAVTGADAERAWIVEGGPSNANGTGNLVPYAYPEDDFASRGIVDFEPVPIETPHGLAPDFFARLVRETQRAYDGDQRYLAVEIPFLRVGRDSNSYAIGVLLACGVDPRAIPKSPATKSLRYEWTGYPGAEDPVHRANFGAYLGAPAKLDDGVIEAAYHDDDGGVRLVVVGGAPNGTARVPDGSVVSLDRFGRRAFSPDDARAHGLPSRHTEPPAQIRTRRRFPADPAPQGAEITLVVGGASVPLAPGTEHAGTIVERHDALGLATLRRADGVDVVLPLAELGVELRDPQRVDRLVHVGTELTVGLHGDRHPKLVAHGDAGVADRFAPHRLHAPRPVNVVAAAAGVAFALAALGLASAWWLLRDEP
jgi:hypothetical protein